jgi:hypothetical protein
LAQAASQPGWFVTRRAGRLPDGIGPDRPAADQAEPPSTATTTAGAMRRPRVHPRGRLLLGGGRAPQTPSAPRDKRAGRCSPDVERQPCVIRSASPDATSTTMPAEPSSRFLTDCGAFALVTALARYPSALPRYPFGPSGAAGKECISGTLPALKRVSPRYPLAGSGTADGGRGRP